MRVQRYVDPALYIQPSHVSQLSLLPGSINAPAGAVVQQLARQWTHARRLQQGKGARSKPCGPHSNADSKHYRSRQRKVDLGKSDVEPDYMAENALVRNTLQEEDFLIPLHRICRNTQVSPLFLS